MDKKYEWAKQKYGDEADSMSPSDIDTEFNKAHGIGTSDSIDSGAVTPESSYLKNKDSDDWARLTAPNANNAFDETKLSPNDLGRLYELKKAHPDWQYGRRIDTTPANIPENTAQVVTSLTGSEEEGQKAKETAQKKVNPNTAVWNDDGSIKESGETSNPANPSPQVQESMVDKAVSGKLDSKDKGYLIANAIATFARNLGKDIGNVAAAYSGGAQDWNHETSLLEDRMAQKAQAGTEEEIMAENPNSRLGQMLRSSNIDIATKAGRKQLADRIYGVLYNPDGSPKYNPESPSFARLATLYNQISNGGGQNYSIMDTLATVGNEWLSKIFY